MKKLITLAALVFALNANAQLDVYLDFPPRVAGNYLTLNTDVESLNGVTMNITYFNYYISNVHIIHDGGQNLDLSDTVFIVKTDAHSLFLGNLNVTNIESITFGVGVPQDVNHADISQYALENPLSWQDPSMHWGWTSGYKFMLCDGYGDSNNDGSADALFQLHNLGDANYKNVSMAVVPTVFPTHTTIVIDCNLDEWLFGVNPGSVGVHHGTTGVNTSVMNNVNSRPVFTLPGNAGIETPTETAGTLSYSISDETVSFVWADVQDVSSYKMIDLSGRVLEAGPATAFNGNHTSNVERSGSYFFYLLASDGTIVKQIQIVR